MKRFISFMLSLILVFTVCAGVMPQAQALHVWVQDRSKVKGSDYTNSDKMAQLLDQIFDGNLSVYSNSKCTTLVNAPIGSSVMKNNGVAMYVGPYGGPAKNSGTSCWIYAQGVYYTLFQDHVYNNKPNTTHSENIDFSGTATTKCTYENFKAWGVRQGVGAMLRSAGHSMILLGYDEEKMVTLEGNANSNGLVCIRERSWDQLENKYTSFAFIVQPTEEYMQEHYGYCKHENMNSFGACADCGYTYNWERTFDSSKVGCYEAVNACTAKADLPYTASENIAGAFSPGDTVEVQGSVTNAFGQSWYKVCLESGATGYVPADCFRFESEISLQVTCTGFQPADQHTMKAASYVLRGTVTSNYPLERIDAYLDDTWYAAWTASNKNTTTVNLQPTNINYSLAFGKLNVGTHVIKLVASSYAHETPVTCHRSTFYIIPSDTGGCTHNYATIAHVPSTCTQEGLLTYQCEYCSNTFTEPLPETGHYYVNGYCVACGALDVNFVFVPAQLKVGTVSGAPGQTVRVPVTVENNPGFAVFAFTASYDKAALTLEGVTAGPLLDSGSLSVSSYINWTSDSNVTGDGTVFYLNFRIAETAAHGTYPVRLGLRSGSTWYFRDENSNARDINFHEGAVSCQNMPGATVMDAGVEQGSFTTLEEAVSHCREGQYIRLNKDQAVALTLTAALYVDLAGFDLTGTVTGGKVYGMDSSTDGYTAETTGSFSCTDSQGNPVIPEPFTYLNARRYAAVKEEGGYSFHRFYLGITHATVKPKTQGVGYKAVFAADDVLAQRIESYGFVMQLPGNDPVTATKEEFVSLETVTMRLDGYHVAAWGEELLSARVFMTIDGNTVTSSGCSYSLRQLVEQINEHAAVLSAEQKAALSAWIEKDPTMQSWNTENICK